MTTLLISKRVYEKHFMSVGDALHAWQCLPSSKKRSVFSFPQADIYVTEKNGCVYMMTKRDLRDERIPFQPFELDRLNNFASMIGGQR